MSLAPLLNASIAIQVHVAAALLALGIGAGILLGPKGTVPHRVMGWLWALAMTVVAFGSFWIHELRLIGDFSPIHILSVVTLIALPILIVRARQGDVRRHRRAVLLLYFGALGAAGIFAFMPGRIMNAVVFGS